MVTSDTWIKFLYKLDNDVQCALKYNWCSQILRKRTQSQQWEIMEKTFLAGIVRKPK